METKSIYRYARISPFKVREVTREIQGLSVQRALDLLAFTPKKAAVLVAKTLKSAVANAENNHQSRSELLVVREAVVGEGPTLNRFVPKARGSAGPIRKRTNHIRIILTDEIEIVTRDKKTASRRYTKGGPAKKSAGKKPVVKTANKTEAGEIAVKATAPAPETPAPAAEETK